MEKISLYELLRLIKTGKAPKKIKITGNIYEYNKDYEFYYKKSNKGNYDVALGGADDEINLVVNAFSENIEIIEEDKKIEYLHYHEGDKLLLYKDTTYQIRVVDIAMIEKIDELIDEVNKLKENK